MKPLLVAFTGTTVPVVKAAFGDFDDHFRHAIGDAWSGPWSTIDVRDEGAPIPDPSEISGVIVTGSSSSVTERAAWMLRFEGWLREAVGRDTAILGVCFGHQLLAQALGGEVRQNPAGRRIGSLSVRRVADDPLFDGVPSTFDINVSHRDHVAVAPEGIRTLVSADHDTTHAFAVGARTRAVQFHPEFRAEIIRGYIEQRRELLRGEGLDPDRLLADVVEPEHAPRILRNFVQAFVKEK